MSGNFRLTSVYLRQSLAQTIKDKLFALDTYAFEHR